MAVTREVVLDVTLPVVKPTARVEARRITMGPGDVAGAHVHNGPVFGVILSGSVIYETAGSAVTLRAGDVFQEAEGARIDRFDAQGDGAVFVGYFLVGPGEAATMIAV